MNTMARITPERFDEGITIAQFIEEMQKNQEQLRHNYDNLQLSEPEKSRLKKIEITINALVLAEDWCGDVVRYLPALARIEETAANWQVRVFSRDDNPDLDGIWLKEGRYRAIPVVVLFDEKMRELGYMVEKPAAVYAADNNARARFAHEHPNLLDAALPSTEMSTATFTLYADYIRKFRAQQLVKWQHFFVDEMLARAEKSRHNTQVAAAS